MQTANNTNRVNRVPIDSPEAITSPITKRDAAPAPVANTSGITPSTIAVRI